MLRNLAWQTTDTLVRAQIALFNASGDQARLTASDRRHVLDLDARAWAAWIDFLHDGPLPAQPPLPEMLRRLGEASHGLAVITEPRGRAPAND